MSLQRGPTVEPLKRTTCLKRPFPLTWLFFISMFRTTIFLAPCNYSLHDNSAPIHVKLTNFSASAMQEACELHRRMYSSTFSPSSSVETVHARPVHTNHFTHKQFSKHAMMQWWRKMSACTWWSRRNPKTSALYIVTSALRMVTLADQTWWRRGLNLELTATVLVFLGLRTWDYNGTYHSPE